MSRFSHIGARGKTLTAGKKVIVELLEELGRDAAIFHCSFET
jgi:hypothetical protein